MSIVAALVVLASAIYFVGDNSQRGGVAASAKDELVFVNFRDIRDLNPHLYAGEMYAQEMLFETLVNLGQEGYTPSLAESWEISDDGRVYTFTIREGVTFTDGTPCDANAVEANFNAILENKSRHTWLEMMKLLVSAKALDERTFRITMSEPYYPMLTELAVTRPFAMISPNSMKDGSTKDGVNSLIGTGPYILKESVTDEYAIFEANATYWRGEPRIKKITVKVIPDNQTRILALQNREIDLIYGKNMLTAESINHFASDEKISALLSEPISTRQILINTTGPVLGEVEVRRALQHATDKEAISKGIFYGLEKPADTLFAKTIPYCDVELEPYKYDIGLAADLLEKAGWIAGADGVRKKSGQRLEFTLRYNSDSVTEKSIAEHLQSEYAKLGAALTIRGEEEQSYRDNMKSGKFDMVFNISWGMPYDPQSSLSAMRQPVYGDYAAQKGIENRDAIYETITQILVSTDEAERQRLYTFVLNELHGQAVYIPLTYECNKALFRKDLLGVSFTQTPYEVPFQDVYF